ncbi:ATP-dependent Clp protease proteolytic subunit, partial [Nocardiopsis alba]|uniref:ATP-dependent Clp protease proteolytic subunit n=1 Tax=Nocardiopsis alba TaxID=53437 RepID=UPI0033C4A092
MSGRYTIPTVIERTPNGERSFDVFSRLLSERIIFLGTSIDDDVANVVMAQMLHLDHESHETDIQLYINSPGGSNTALTAIYDTMGFVRAGTPWPRRRGWCPGRASGAARSARCRCRPGWSG